MGEKKPTTLITLIIILIMMVAVIYLAGTCQDKPEVEDIEPGAPDSLATECDSTAGVEPPPPDIRTGAPE